MKTFNKTVIAAITMILAGQSMAVGVYAPIGAWVVEHGYLRISYAFANNGTYAYQYTGSGRDEEETGTFAVQSDNLILQPNGRPQKVLRWSIGSDITAVNGEPILWLIDSYGRKEMFYPQ